LVNVNTWDLVNAGKMLEDCADVRFASDTGTDYPYWIDLDSSSCNANVTDFWVKAGSIPTGDSTFYMYYGNNEATAVADGDATFQFFDDFEDNQLDTEKWDLNVVGSIVGTETGGVYHVTDASTR